MVYEVGDRVMDKFGVDNVVVIENESEVIPNSIDLINQRRQDRLHRRRLWRMQQRQGVLADPGLDCLQRGDEVLPEPRGVAITLIK